MRMNTRTLSAGVFAAMLLLTAAGCKKKAPAPPPPPPPPTAEAPKPPPPAPKPQAPVIANFAVDPRNIQRGQSATLTVERLQRHRHEYRSEHWRHPGQWHPQCVAVHHHQLHADGARARRERQPDRDARQWSQPPTPLPPPPAKPRVSGADMLSREAKDAYFDYDKSVVRDDARTALTQDADLLKRIFAADPTFNVSGRGKLRRARLGRVQPGIGRPPCHFGARLPDPTGSVRPTG